MALTKVNYIDNETVITAANMNAIQDEVIKNSEAIEKGIAAPTLRATYDEETQTMKFENVPKEVEDQLYAPSGYGLGQEDTYVIANTNTALKDGRYGIDASTYQTPIADNGVLVVVSRDANVKHQTIYYSNSERTICHRDVVGGYFQPWEFENPPMLLGVEYRTTERLNGKAVYAKYFNAGVLMNNTEYSLPSGATQLVRFGGHISGGVALPVGVYTKNDTTSGYFAFISAGNGGNSVWAYTDTRSDGYGNGGHYLHLILHYTKD